jgi:pimeloyl-ACP methyl ester carboxylesterase
MNVDDIEAWQTAYDGAREPHRTPDGCRLYYETAGTGPTITFVSTIYVASTAWRNFTRTLVHDHHILTYDLRNQGASSDAPAPFSQHAQDLLSLLDGLHIQSTYLVGTSISTMICRDFALAHPDRVTGLILVGPPFSPWGSARRRRIASSWITALDTAGPRGLFDLIYPLVFGDQALARGGTPAYLALRERFLAMNSHAQLNANLTAALDADDDPDLLRRITAPTLLLTGDDDFTTTASTLHAIADLMPDATVEIIHRCGHLPYFEATDRFQDAIARFVRTVETSCNATHLGRPT